MTTLLLRQTLALKALRVAENLLLLSPYLGDLELSEEIDALAEKLEKRVICTKTVYATAKIDFDMRSPDDRVAELLDAVCGRLPLDPDYVIVVTG